MEFLPIRPAIARSERWSAAPAVRIEASPRCAPRYGARAHIPCAQEESMKSLLSIILAAALMCAATPATYAAPSHQVMQGTQVHLNLLTNISTSVSKDGDPFVAIVAEPVFIGN